MPEIFSNILGIIANWGRWSEMVQSNYIPDIMSGSIKSENILSMSIRMASYSGCL